MATTTGFVQLLTWSEIGPVACAWIGPSAVSAELFFVEFRALDPENVIQSKKIISSILWKAQVAGYPVRLTHADDSAVIEEVTIGGFDICPIGPAIHGDFYAVSGSAIPDDAELVFDTGAVAVTVTPDLVPPHWVFVSELPSIVLEGRAALQLVSTGGGWSSDTVPVGVHPAAPTTVRVLYSGAGKARPYTIAFVANAGILTESDTLIADPILTDRPGFHDVVRYALADLLTRTENLLRQGDLDSRVRLVTIFDSSLPADDDHSLAHELSPNFMETPREYLNAFLAGNYEWADMVFVLHGSTTHDRATSWFTSDNAGLGGTPYTYDGTNRTHGHYPEIPGSMAIPVGVDETGHTALHEFGHGGSDFDNGMVNDLYVDGVNDGFVVNKKWRVNAADAIPNSFASYDISTYLADQNRDGLGYPGAWTSFHPGLMDATRPNLMDNYWLAFDDPLNCRLDQLTYAWFSDRLRAKIFR